MSTSKNKPARAVSDAVLLSIAAGVALGVSIAVGREQGAWAGVAVFGPLLGAAFTALLLLHRTVLTALAVVAVLASMAAPDAPLRTTLAAPSAPQTNLCVSQFPLPGCHTTIDLLGPVSMGGMYTLTARSTQTNATPHVALIPGACNGPVWNTVNDSDFVLAVSNKIAEMMALWAEPPAVAPPQ